MSTTKTNTYVKSDYIQSSSSSSHAYDSSQSPLALLAQTCSSIGKDYSSSYSSSSTRSKSISPVITSLVTKSSSNSDKSSSSIKRSSPNSTNVYKKPILPLQTPTILPPDPNLLLNLLPPLFDPINPVTSLLLRSSLAYLAAQQHSYLTSCTIPGCLYCETSRHISSTSINTHSYVCHMTTCNARFSSNNELMEHIRYEHRPSKLSNHHHRFHPYLKPSKIMNRNDQLPFFYPHLSFSSMTETTQCLNNNPDKNN